MRRRRTWLIVAVTAVAILAAIGYANWRQRYPYGWSHCCDKALSMSLMTYADRHDGWFPKGEATPEASLSLLYRDDPEWGNPNLLRGKSVPEAEVRKRLEAGELLSPETCGWHYVEGLRTDDDPGLALFWDKAGLGHNGERLSGGGRFVCTIHGSDRYIPAEEWDAFLADQASLRAKLKR